MSFRWPEMTPKGALMVARRSPGLHFEPERKISTSLIQKGIPKDPVTLRLSPPLPLCSLSPLSRELQGVKGYESFNGRIVS